MNTKSLFVYIGGTLVSLLLCAGLVLVGYLVVDHNKVTETELIAEVEEVEVEEPVVVDPTALQLTCSTPEYNYKKRTYTVKLTTINTDGASLKYEILNENKELIKKRSTLTITLDPTESGVYYARVIATKGSDVRTAEVQITECTAHKMTAARLETICNSGNYSTMTTQESYDLVSKPKLTFNGLPKAKWARNLSDVCKKISNRTWKSVQVKNVTYDNKYRISAVEFDVVLQN